ncbi:hypothetical protein B4U79_14835 [Dinothrombium tinctorium]|uniref:Uncharacterized protein n=1 Tax=Dinothrombium tinctorium TaxID=1965070 RepID=A0A3S3PEF4_9ACAR|nr:hypothetical protein B4U79_04714 [Dinothrombium tinctorium]RWS11050.1 hypothetical protein B4U79_14835 [Dinothrombium tinctorium]
MKSRKKKKDSDIPECVDSKGVCGYLQLNAFGISTQAICRCRNGITCPLVWDPFDSRTISHGNDQYKYCTEAPKLRPCTEDDMAFTTYTEMSSLTMETLVNNNQVHCHCPAKYLLVRNSTQFHEFNNVVSVIATTSLCKPPPRCELKDICMAITESAYSSFVTRKCSCPLGTFCPIDIRLASDRIDLDKGSYYTMQCI